MGLLFKRDEIANEDNHRGYVICIYQDHEK